MAYEVTRQDAVKILDATVGVMLDNDFKVTVNNLKAINQQPEGVILFVAGVVYQDGEFRVLESEPVV